ncbi:hypothetical protein GOP47_0006404 [Adiantum capillus-veneris]|uniref:Uncharacterized protein n=1 Tax=Adiantum capillus-veneris TaxID=13818 RepID=A0A9D4V304_ADICA|nr:hypothetical protein GOP47_0006404 [Adiantum capillus-veneris]
MQGSALRRDVGEALESTSCKRVIRKCKGVFCIGVNDVTRTLERMPCVCNGFSSSLEGDKPVEDVEISTSVDTRKGLRKITLLQVVIVAIDVHPRLLVSHFPELAASRKVPLITLSGGNGSGSLRLGELFHLRTAIAVGLKVGDSELNKAISCFLKDTCRVRG